MARWIGEDVPGPKPKYFLQNFRPGRNIDPEFEARRPFPPEFKLKLKSRLSRTLPNLAFVDNAPGCLGEEIDDCCKNLSEYLSGILAGIGLASLIKVSSPLVFGAALAAAFLFILVFLRENTVFALPEFCWSDLFLVFGVSIRFGRARSITVLSRSMVGRSRFRERSLMIRFLLEPAAN